MQTRIQAAPRARSGSITVLTAAAAILIFGCMALAIDFGWVVSERNRLQTAVNAGWKAGFDFQQQISGASNRPLTVDEKNKVVLHVLQVLASNGFPANQLSSTSVTIGANGALTVAASRNVGLFFANVLNFSKVSVGAARGGTENSGIGAVPLGIPHGVVKELPDGNHIAVYLFPPGEEFKLGEEYILKMGNGNPGGAKPTAAKCLVCNGTGKIKGVVCTACGGTGISGGLTADPNDIEIDKSSSNFGALDPDNSTGGGANDYRDRLMYGFNQGLQLNDRIKIETGNIAGPSTEAITYRLSHNPPLTRVIVPIMDVPPEALANHPNAKTLYALQQADNPNGVYNVAAYAFQHSPRIIGFAEFEIKDPTQWTRAGTNFDLGDSGDLGPVDAGQVRATFKGYIIKP